MLIFTTLITAACLARSHELCQAITIAAMPRHGAQERRLNLLRGPSLEQTHHILYHCRVTGQGDPPAVDSVGEPKFLLGHPKQISEDGRAKVNQRDLEPPAVIRVHDAMALAGHRRHRHAAGSFG